MLDALPTWFVTELHTCIPWDEGGETQILRLWRGVKDDNPLLVVRDDLHQRSGFDIVLHRHDNKKWSVALPVPDSIAHTVFDVEVLVSGDSLDLLLSRPDVARDGAGSDEEDTGEAWWRARLKGAGRRDDEASVIAKLKAVPSVDGGATWIVQESMRNRDTSC